MPPVARPPSAHPLHGSKMLYLLLVIHIHNVSTSQGILREFIVVYDSGTGQRLSSIVVSTVDGMLSCDDCGLLTMAMGHRQA